MRLVEDVLRIVPLLKLKHARVVLAEDDLAFFVHAWI